MDLRTLISQLVNLYAKLNKNQKIIIASTIIVIIAFIIFMLIYNKKTTSDEYKVLFDELSSKDASLIVEQLEKDNIKYKLSDNSIEVPQKEVYKQRIKIAGMGLPKSSRVGFELFDKQEFGATDFDQKVKYTRALEGELSRTIEVLKPIKKAKVHISIPKESLFVSKQIKPSASVTLEIKDDMRLNRMQVLAIKNIVSSSVAKMPPSNVKITNSDGYPLGEDDKFTQISEQAKLEMKYKRTSEVELEDKITEILSPFLGGRDRVVAKVTIDYDFSKKEETKEQFDPENVVRSEQSLEEKREGLKPKQIGGVPGVVSNIGPVEGISNNNLGEKYSKNEVSTNYEISKVISKVKGEFATIKRITASVIVDGKYRKKTDENGIIINTIEYVPLEAQQVDALKNIVTNAIGIDLKRGDQVSITNLPFSGMEYSFTEHNELNKLIKKLNSYLGPIEPIIKYLIAIIFLLILYLKVIKPFAQRMVEFTAKEELDRKSILDFDEEEDEDIVGKVQDMRKKIEEGLNIGDEFNEEGLKHEVLLEKIKDIMLEKPEDVAILFKNLITEESQGM